MEPIGCDCVTPGWALNALGSLHTAVGKPSVAGKAQRPVGPKSLNQPSRSERAGEPALPGTTTQVGVSSGAVCAAPPPRSQRPADWLARRLQPSRAGASLAPGCGRRGMDPQAATGRGPGEPSSLETPSAEVSATGWGTQSPATTPATTRAGSREARAPRRGRSPGKRRGHASARRAWPVTAVGAGTRADPSPRLWPAPEGEGHRGCSGPPAGVNARNAELAGSSRGGPGWVGAARKRIFLDLWPLTGMCRSPWTPDVTRAFSPSRGGRVPL